MSAGSRCVRGWTGWRYSNGDRATKRLLVALCGRALEHGFDALPHERLASFCNPLERISVTTQDASMLTARSKRRRIGMTVSARRHAQGQHTGWPARRSTPEARTRRQDATRSRQRTHTDNNKKCANAHATYSFQERKHQCSELQRRAQQDNVCSQRSYHELQDLGTAHWSSQLSSRQATPHTPSKEVMDNSKEPMRHQ